MADIPTVAMKEENGCPGLFRRDKPPGNPNTIFRSEVYVLIIKAYVLWRGLNLPEREVEVFPLNKSQKENEKEQDGEKEKGFHGILAAHGSTIPVRINNV
jgi:hypothetical protein